MVHHKSITFGGNSDMQTAYARTKSRGDNSDPIIRDSQRGIGNRLLMQLMERAVQQEQPLSILMDFLDSTEC